MAVWRWGESEPDRILDRGGIEGDVAVAACASRGGGRVVILNERSEVVVWELANDKPPLLLGTVLPAAQHWDPGQASVMYDDSGMEYVVAVAVARGQPANRGPRYHAVRWAFSGGDRREVSEVSRNEGPLSGPPGAPWEFLFKSSGDASFRLPASWIEELTGKAFTPRFNPWDEPRLAHVCSTHEDTAFGAPVILVQSSRRVESTTRLPFGFGEYALAFSPDGKLLAASGRRGIVRLWSLDAGRFEKTLRLDDRPPETFGAAAISPTWSPQARIEGWGPHRIAEDIVVLPELALSLLPGLRGAPSSGRDRIAAAPEPTLLGGELLDDAARAARRARTYLVAPFLELDPRTERRFSAAVIFDPHGQVILHARKKGPWTETEKDWAHEGHLGTPAVDTPYGRMGVLLGGDIEAEAKALAAQRVDLALHPLPWPGAAAAEDRLQELARRHGFQIIAAGWHVPPDGGGVRAGTESVIIARDGQVLARSKDGEPGREDAVAALPLPRG